MAAQALAVKGSGCGTRPAAKPGPPSHARTVTTAGVRPDSWCRSSRCRNGRVYTFVSNEFLGLDQTQGQSPDRPLHDQHGPVWRDVLRSSAPLQLDEGGRVWRHRQPRGRCHRLVALRLRTRHPLSHPQPPTSPPTAQRDRVGVTEEPPRRAPTRPRAAAPRSQALLPWA